MIKNFFSFLLIIDILSKTYHYEYEKIEELISYNIIAEFELELYYKIFQYIPICNDNNNSTKNIYFQFVGKSTSYYLYKYSNFSKIFINQYNNFINYDEYHSLFLRPSILFENLICGKDYYFIISRKIYSITNPELFQISVVDADIDTINISNLPSPYLTIIPRNENEEIFFYYSNETKYILIHFSDTAQFKIVENITVIEEIEKSEISKLYEFKNNCKYYISYKADTIALIMTQLFLKPIMNLLSTNMFLKMDQ